MQQIYNYEDYDLDSRFCGTDLELILDPDGDSDTVYIDPQLRDDYEEEDDD